MIRLITSYYLDSNSDRQSEIDECLSNNVNNEYLDEILLFCKSIPNTKNKKIKIIKSNRPTFNDFLTHVNDITGEEDINILSNTDIFFDKSLNKLKQFPIKGKVLCLLRWERNKEGASKIKTIRADCQDSWIFKGKIKTGDMWLDFHMGKLGCDNRICYEFKNAGYKLENPCFLIRSHHLHNTNKRNYKETLVGQEGHSDNKDVIPPPYEWVQPVNTAWYRNILRFFKGLRVVLFKRSR
ncbi:MAG: hypothetical protein IMY67_10215 [Bacteroidetes bacterium]|nr:hypothetical protein [Bacteroidota bacterium]